MRALICMLCCAAAVGCAHLPKDAAVRMSEVAEDFNDIYLEACEGQYDSPKCKRVQQKLADANRKLNAFNREIADE